MFLNLVYYLSIDKWTQNLILQQCLHSRISIKTLVKTLKISNRKIIYEDPKRNYTIILKTYI